MKYYIMVQGDADVGIEPEEHEIILEFGIGPQDYDIEFYNELEKNFIELIKEAYDNGTKVEVETQYERDQREEFEDYMTEIGASVLGIDLDHSKKGKK